MRANIPQNNRVLKNLECDAGRTTGTRLPDIFRPLDFFHAQTWMPQIARQKSQSFFDSLAVSQNEIVERRFESIRPREFHRDAFMS